MPSYVRTRLLAAREFAIGELAELRTGHPAYDEAVIENVRKVVPFDYYFFSGVNLDNCHTGDFMLLMSDMPTGGVEAYHQSGLVKFDPLVTCVTPEKPVLAWADVPKEIFAKPEVQALVRLLEQYQIPPRLIISLWNEDREFYGTVGFARQAPFLPHEIAMLEWFGTRFHHDLCEPVLRGFNQQIGLTPSEKSCLELSSQGLTSDQIGEKLSISSETVNTYFKAIVKKMGASSRIQAVADAIRLELIS